MRTSHRTLTRAHSRRPVARLAVALALVLGLMGLGMGPASAHHPEITASSDCDGKVTWTANSWSTGLQGTNPDIRVERSIAGGAWTEIAQGAFNADNAYKFSGSFDAGLPYPSSVQLRVKSLANWANGAAGGQTFGPVTVTFPTDCIPPAEAKPTAAITADCTGFTATLANLEGTAPALFTLVAPEGTTEDITVPAGEQTTRTFPVTEDTTQTVKILANGNTLAEKTYTADCIPPAEAKPTAAITADCTGFTATLANLEGTAPALFTLVAPEGTTEDITVPAGEQTTRTFPATEDTTQTVKILANGNTLAEKTYTADCIPPAEAKPTAAITADCTGFTATLANLEGTAPALFTLVAPEGTTEDITVPAGEQTTRTFPATEDTTQTVKILANGNTLAEKTYTADCILGEDVVQPRPPVKLPTVIKGVSTVKPQAAAQPQAAVLPQTGASDHQGPLLAGLLLVALGGSLLVARRGERA